jgi:hypothetical protein
MSENTNLVGGDIYEIEKYIDNIKKNHIDEDENTLKIGIFGFMSDLFTREINQSIMMSSEGLNQIFPTRATQEKYILTHATEANVQDIESVPSIMKIMLGMTKEDMERNMVQNVLLLDCDIPIYVDKYEFHFDYDIRIEKTAVNNKDIYTARYIINETNPVSDIKNPYILPPIQFTLSGDTFLFFEISVRQIFKTKDYNKIITSDKIENKSYRFEFTNQLSKFHLKITNLNGTQKILYPLYRGTPIIDNTKLYCYYDYYDETTVRVYFIDDQYIPEINDEICTIIQTSLGADGNFEYSQDFQVMAKSPNREYNDLRFLIQIREHAVFGADKKSIEELKTITPKERLGRNVITCAQDLENFFNGLYDNTNRIKFYKKIHNHIDTRYFAYILMKDNSENIIPTNTIDFEVTDADFDLISDNSYIIKPGKKFRLNKNQSVAKMIDPLEPNPVDLFFDYTNIFMIYMSKRPTVILYYLNTFNFNKLLNFDFINTDADLQFIGNKANWVRNMGDDEYRLKIDFAQNIKENMGVVTKDETGAITSSTVSIYAVLKDETGAVVRYKKFEINGFNEQKFELNTLLTLQTSNKIDDSGKLEILDMCSMRSIDVTPINISPIAASVTFYIYRKEDTKYYTNPMDSQLPLDPTDVLCNIYSISGGLDFLLDYTGIMNSTLSIIREEGLPDRYVFKSSPMIKYNYGTSKENIDYIINRIREKRIYLLSALSQLEHSIGIDFKFFNTYGPSKSFNIGRGYEKIDRVNITLKFAVKCYVGADNNIRELVIGEIKSYIENINNISDLSISRLTKIILEKFTDIQDFEFKGINNYTTDYQNITNVDINNYRLTHTPEFLNINNSSDIGYSPDIIVDIV